MRLIDSTLSTAMLSASDLVRFEQLLEQTKEGPCQAFLARHQEFLLDAFGQRVCIPKFRFGAEFESDFVLIDSSSQGLSATLVELEPPSTKPFNLDGTFSRRLNQALNQIHSWLAWAERHGDYFRERLIQEIRKRPGGSLEVLEYRFRMQRTHLQARIIIGRRAHLTDETNEKRLSLFSSTSGKIELTNYDRLLEAGVRNVAKQVREVESRPHLGKLGRGSSSGLRLAVAESTKVSKKTLEYLSEDPELAVRIAVAANPLTDPKILGNLSTASNSDVQRAVALNPRTNKENLEALYSLDTKEIQEAVLRNVGCPTSVLASASKSADWEFRLLVARHPMITPEVQYLLAEDSNDRIRSVLSANKNLSREIAESMLTDRNKIVRLGIYTRSDLSEGLVANNLRKEPSWIRSTVAQHPNLSSAVLLSALAADSDPEVRVATTRNANLPRGVLETLLKDTDQRVRSAAAATLKE